MNDLHGVSIVITRPYAQAEPWSKRLQDLGANTEIIPLLEIVPVREPAQVRAIQNCILDFDLYDKAIFVSQNAVEHGFEWIENYWPQSPVRIDFFAVGETTAKQLDAHGVRVADLAQTQSGAMTSETLLQSPALQNVAGNKILIFRGVGGRSLLGEELQARGAKVDYCELYERRLPEKTVNEFAKIFQRVLHGEKIGRGYHVEAAEITISDDASSDKNRSDFAALEKNKSFQVVTMHSGEALQNFCEILESSELQAGEKERLLMELILLVPGERVLAQAQAAGFSKTFAAQNATDASMLQGLLDLKHNLHKGQIL